ncbi:hypothetical protein AAMO2058_000863800 [Amorphochlora amoebiformis]
MVKDKSTLIGLILTALFAVIVIIVTATRNAPFVMGNSLFCLGLSVVFIMTEQASWGWWHRYRESENRFWCAVAALFAAGVIFARDSPLGFGSWYPRTGIIIIFIFTLYVNHWERDFARRNLGARVTARKELKRRYTSALFSPELVDSARAKLKRVKNCLKLLDYKFAALKTWNQLDILRREREILYILSTASSDELNYILTNINLPLLFYKIKDNDLLTPARLLSLRRIDPPRAPSRNSTGLPLDLEHPRAEADSPRIRGMRSTPVQSPSPMTSPGLMGLPGPDGLPGLGDEMSPLTLPVASPEDVKVHMSKGGGGLLRMEDKDQEGENANDDEGGACWNLCGGMEEMDLDGEDARSIPKSMRNRTQVLNLCAKDRLPELKMEARAMVVSAMQQMPLSAHQKGEELVANVILSTYGDELRQIKHHLDTGGDFYNLQKLVFSDIRSKDIQKTILTHFQYEASQVLQYRREIKGSTLPFPNSIMRPSLRKILSDVDDTLFASGGRFPAGIDAKFDHHTLYPGVLAFYKELDLGLAPSSNGEWPSHWKGNLAFLSARPHVYKDWSQKKSYKLFQLLKTKHKLHTMPTLLAGELFSSFQMFRGDFEPMAQKKYQNYSEYASLYPEYTFVFIGDNGQGDVTAAEKMIERDGKRVESVFIHKVQDLSKTPGFTDDSLAKWERMGIIFFETYVGAALQACKRELISPRGLRTIAIEAVREFRNITFQNEEQRFARLQELNRDIEQCNEYLRSKELKQVPFVPAKHTFACGSLVRVETFGLGRVLKFRHYDGVYEIELLSFSNAKSEGKVLGTPYSPGVSSSLSANGIESLPGVKNVSDVGRGQVRCFTLGSHLSWAFRGSPGDRVWTPYGTGILEQARETDGVHVVRMSHIRRKPRSSRRQRSRKPKHKRGGAMVMYLQPKHIQVIKAAVGDIVTTAFGQGIVHSFRKPDGVYTVHLQWGNPSQRPPRIPKRRRSLTTSADAQDEKAASEQIVKSGVVVKAYLVASQIHRVDGAGSSRCSIS